MVDEREILKEQVVLLGKGNCQSKTDHKELPFFLQHFLLDL